MSIGFNRKFGWTTGGSLGFAPALAGLLQWLQKYTGGTTVPDKIGVLNEPLVTNRTVLTFNGVDEYVDTDLNLDFGQAFDISFKIKTTDNTGAILTSDGVKGIRIFNGELCYTDAAGGNANHPTNINTGLWVTCRVTKSEAGTVSLYVNGSPTPGFAGKTGISGVKYIGGFTSGTGTAKLDGSLINLDISGVAYFPFEEGDFNKVYDVSGNGYTGTITSNDLDSMWSVTYDTVTYNGKYGFDQVATFNGSEYVRLDKEITLPNTWTLTANLLLDPDLSPNYGKVFVSGEAWVEGVIGIQRDNNTENATLRVWSNGTVVQPSIPIVGLYDGEWHDLEIIYSDGDYTVRLDGSIINSGTQLDGGVGFAESTRFSIMSDWNGLGNAVGQIRSFSIDVPNQDVTTTSILTVTPSELDGIVFWYDSGTTFDGWPVYYDTSNTYAYWTRNVAVGIIVADLITTIETVGLHNTPNRFTGSTYDPVNYPGDKVFTGIGAWTGSMQPTHNLLGDTIGQSFDYTMNQGVGTKLYDDRTYQPVDATLSDTNVWDCKIPAIINTKASVLGEPISHWGGKAHNNGGYTIQQISTELLVNPFWSSNGSTFDDKTFTDLYDNISYENNVLAYSDGYTISDILTYDINKDFEFWEFNKNGKEEDIGYTYAPGEDSNGDLIYDVDGVMAMFYPITGDFLDGDGYFTEENWIGTNPIYWNYVGGVASYGYFGPDTLTSSNTYSFKPNTTYRIKITVSNLQQQTDGFQIKLHQSTTGYSDIIRGDGDHEFYYTTSPDSGENLNVVLKGFDETGTGYAISFSNLSITEKVWL